MRKPQLSPRIRTGGVLVLAVAMGAAVTGAASVAHAEPTSAPNTSDFDGDGKSDLAMSALEPGSPDEAVVVDYSSDLDSQRLAPETAYGSDGFGVGLAAGDLNDDGFDDLAVGCTNCDWEWSGPTVSIYKGSESGLEVDTAMDFEIPGANHATAIGELDGKTTLDVASTREGGFADISSFDGDSWSADSHPVEPPPATDDERLGALAVGDVTGDGKDDLVLGTPTADGGAVTLFPGPVSKDDQQTVKAVHINPTLRDFGASLAVADVTGDGFADVIAGAPTSTTGGTSCGAVELLIGSDNGIGPDHSQRINQETDSVPGVCESGDNWGASVAAGNIDADVEPEAIVGVPDEAINNLANAGTYTVLQPTDTGLTGVGSFGVSQATDNVPGTTESGDGFASALVLRDMNADGRMDVLAGAPGEDVGSSEEAGQVVTAISGGNGAPDTGTSEVTGDGYGLQRLGWELA